MDVVWASVFALAYLWLQGYRAGAVAVWVGVVSHWVLDFVTHRPDMPLFPGGGPKLGLGLWNSIPGTMIVEGAMLALGVRWYTKATRARDGIGRYGFWAYVAFLVAAYVGDRFGGPPAGVRELAWTGLIAEAVLLGWAWWFDAHRVAREL
jgi:hypothetical protein